MNSRQYTIRSVPERVDRELRKRAKSEGKSLNSVIIELLEQAVVPNGKPPRNRNFERFSGTWVEDPAFDEAMRYFEQIDEEMWK